MSAIVVCGKRSFFEELPSSPTSSSPPVSKKIRCSSSSSSPVRFFPNPPAPVPALIDRLRALFPGMDEQLIEKALKDNDNDIESAIKSLHDLRLGYRNVESGSLVESNASLDKDVATTNDDVLPVDGSSAQGNHSLNGAEWVELLVSEMMSATSIDDARSRAMRVLEGLEKSITERAGSEAAQTLHKENTILREQIEVLLRDNMILKRAVAIQHERQKEHDERAHEVQQLKQLVSQYQEQMRTLEVNNYALTMHLQQAQGSSSIPGHFHPDVF